MLSYCSMALLELRKASEPSALPTPMLFSPLPLVGWGPGERAGRFRKHKTKIGAPSPRRGARRAPAAFVDTPGRTPCAPAFFLRNNAWGICEERCLFGERSRSDIPVRQGRLIEHKHIFNGPMSGRYARPTRRLGGFLHFRRSNFAFVVAACMWIYFRPFPLPPLRGTLSRKRERGKARAILPLAGPISSTRLCCHSKISETSTVEASTWSAKSCISCNCNSAVAPPGIFLFLWRRSAKFLELGMRDSHLCAVLVRRSLIEAPVECAATQALEEALDFSPFASCRLLFPG